MLKYLKVRASSLSQVWWIDPLLWVLVLLLGISGFVINYHWPAFPIYLKFLFWLLLVVVGVFLMGLTQKGLALFKFSKEARAELRKVHWPTRQETVQTTLMVVVMVILVGLFLWGVDALLIWAINALTGQRG